MKANGRLIVSVGVLVLFLGCASAPNPPPQPIPAPAPAAASTGYIIQTGDSLDIKFFYNPELNEVVQVRPDGFISLQLVDEVKAAGLEPRELTRKLIELYSKELKKPVLTVIVRSFEGQRVYVGGEVNTQGLITMPAGLTALQAVMQSGGFRPSAQPSETLIIRKGPDRRPVPMRVDLNSLIEGNPNGGDFRLQPDDIVFVPQSPIAKANQFVRQYIEELLLFRGVSLGFGVGYQLNNNND